MPKCQLEAHHNRLDLIFRLPKQKLYPLEEERLSRLIWVLLVLRELMLVLLQGGEWTTYMLFMSFLHVTCNMYYACHCCSHLYINTLIDCSSINYYYYCSGLAVKKMIDCGAGVVDADCKLPIYKWHIMTCTLLFYVLTTWFMSPHLCSCHHLTNESNNQQI